MIKNLWLCTNILELMIGRRSYLWKILKWNWLSLLEFVPINVRNLSFHTLLYKLLAGGLLLQFFGRTLLGVFGHVCFFQRAARLKISLTLAISFQVQKCLLLVVVVRATKFEPESFKCRLAVFARWIIPEWRSGLRSLLGFLLEVLNLLGRCLADCLSAEGVEVIVD